jgi:hypothetical protein
MHSYIRLRQNRSINTLSIQRPRPSIEMRTPADCIHAGEAWRRKMAALVGVEDFGLGSRHRLLQRLDAELNIPGFLSRLSLVIPSRQFFHTGDSHKPELRFRLTPPFSD